MPNNKIFVSIASYRDSELEKTVDDLFEMANIKERVFVGICLQDTDEIIKNFKYNHHKQVRIYSINFKKAKGVCYARKIIQNNLIQDEDYYLQIDSHSRFAKDWDSILMSSSVEVSESMFFRSK